MSEGGLVPKDEVRATLEARRELGPEYEDELVERFAARVEARLAQRAAPPPAKISGDQRTAISIISLGVAIPLIAIASGVGLAGVALVCLALVLVNLFAWRA